MSNLEQLVSPPEIPGNNPLPLEHTNMVAEQAVSSKSLPIIDMEGVFYDKDSPILTENVITHYFHEASQAPGSRSHIFKLLKEIDAMGYVFALTQTYGNIYEFAFYTDEYAYATTNLSEEGQQMLENTMRDFIETIKERKDIEISEVDVNPANAGFSVRDIEDCIEEILLAPNNTLSREEILKKHNGAKTFDLYHNIYGKIYESKSGDSRDLSEARSRYFKRIFKRSLPGWQVGKGKRFALKKQPQT